MCVVVVVVMGVGVGFVLPSMQDWFPNQGLNYCPYTGNTEF